LPAGVIALQDRQVHVYIEAPSIDLEKSADLPPGISAGWLVDQVKASLRRQLGEIHVDGPVGASPVTVFHAGGERAAVRHDEYLTLFLHCRDGLCALVVGREHGDERLIQHAALLPGMSRAQWSDVVRSATDRLYE
jgi:hypothetical protein